MDCQIASLRTTSWYVTNASFSKTRMILWCHLFLSVLSLLHLFLQLLHGSPLFLHSTPFSPWLFQRWHSYGISMSVSKYHNKGCALNRSKRPPSDGLACSVREDKLTRAMKWALSKVVCTFRMLLAGFTYVVLHDLVTIHTLLVFWYVIKYPYFVPRAFQTLPDLGLPLGTLCFSLLCFIADHVLGVL